MKPDIIVIDDFYQNPFRVRELAISLSYENETTPNYPGYQSTIPCLNESVVSKLESAIGQRVNLALSRPQMGYFRYISEAGKSRLRVHTDLVNWTGVIYLNPQTDPSCGTSFYRHIQTGLEGPPNLDQMVQFNYSGFKDYERKLIERDTLDSSKWMVTREIENKFNRCVLFRSSELFHSHSRGFGRTLQDSRLTQNFFISTEDGNA